MTVSKRVQSISRMWNIYIVLAGYHVSGITAYITTFSPESSTRPLPPSHFSIRHQPSPPIDVGIILAVTGQYSGWNSRACISSAVGVFARRISMCFPSMFNSFNSIGPSCR